MAEVTGNLKDITGGLMTSREGVIQFTLNTGNIRVTNDNIVPDNTREAIPDPDTGEFSINLDDMRCRAGQVWSGLEPPLHND